ncbi:DUF4136 domain-containing protein [Undibacterium terreum]|uniref:DUF4136 domain-containing protein n=1 Tax=Undibacterium terreum TaxID=1224302 RepID=A0A916XMZ1_9BURK|nr:DUF4136 domain-containing protein [Undibacterium terreum]GGC85097.1 hypothetical protein GCM10011396_35510 [Undibacterium terreum]
MKNTLRSTLFYFLALPLSLLAGCSTVTSQVTVFHEWPADVKEKTYVFDKQAVQQNNLEYNSYENLVRNKLNQSGFTEANSGNPVFKVALNYHTEPSDVQISLPSYYGWNDPFWRFHRFGPYYRPYFYPYGFYGPYGPYGPGLPMDLEVRRWYKHELDMLISDAGTGKQLFDIRSSTESMNQTLNTQMVNLVESAFKEFPGSSGVTKKVETPISK